MDSVLGAGAMAVVFRGTDRSLDRPVAIKVLRPELATAVGAERFVREGKRLANLSHPHLLSVHDAGEADGLYYYVTDLIEADSLRTQFDKGRLPADDVVHIVMDLLEALEVVHASGLVHRDVKPENVLILEGHPLLADFGIAKSLDDDGGALTRAGAFMGTPAYMSPEQAQGRPVGPASDLYSVGQLLYEGLTGRRWPLGASADDVDWSGVPTSLEPILLTALEPVPENRWPDAGSFRAALARSGLAPAARRSKAGWYVAAIVAIAGVELFLWSPWSAKSPPIEAVAVGRCEDVSPTSDQPELAFSIGESLSRAFRQRQLGLTVRDYSAWEGPTDVLEIAQALGVDAVASCSVQSDGPEGRRVRGTVRLSSPTGDRLWDWDIDESLTDFDQSAASAVALAFEQPIDIGAVPSSGAISSAAIQAYNRGRLAWSRRTEDPAQLWEALRHYETALELAPRFPLALAGMAECYAALPGRVLMSPADAFTRARELADSAVALDESLAGPYAVLGETIRAHDWDRWAEAEAAFSASIERDPSHGVGRLWYAQFLTGSERSQEAIGEAVSAYESAPLDVDLGIGLGLVLYLNGEADAAVEQLRDVVERSANAWEGQLWLVAALIEVGERSEALARLEALGVQIATSGESAREAARPILAAGFAAVADTAAAREYLDPPSPRTPFWNAVTYSQLGDRDRAFQELDFALLRRDEFLTYVGVFPLLDSLRADPRYGELAAELPWLSDR